jgi:hypothetical protein
MRRGLVARVERLEGQDKQGRLRAHVVYLRPDGQPEHPEDFEVEGPIICLPRKAPSAEAWVAQCAARFQHREEWQGSRAPWVQNGGREAGAVP